MDFLWPCDRVFMTCWWTPLWPFDGFLKTFWWLFDGVWWIFDDLVVAYYDFLIDLSGGLLVAF